MSTKMSTKKSVAMPFVLKDKYISVMLAGQPHSFTEGHPSFAKIKKALEQRNFKQVESLIDAAAKFTKQSAGKITLDHGVVYYNGEPVHTALSKQIIRMAQDGHSVKFLLKFLNNVYLNPWKEAHTEIIRFIGTNKPITDDGCFYAYKAVRCDWTDKYSGKVNNKPGQVLLFPRRKVDADPRNTCSSGFHFMTIEYAKGFMGSGDRMVAIKINPRDVVEIAIDENKGRTWKYEVICELKGEYSDMVKSGHPLLEQNSVVEIYKERKELLKMLLAHPEIKKRIKSRKIKKVNLMKSTFGRLKRMQESLSDEKTLNTLFINPLKAARETAKLSVKQMAKELELSVNHIEALEREDDPLQRDIDNYLEAIQNIKPELDNGISI